MPRFLRLLPLIPLISVAVSLGVGCSKPVPPTVLPERVTLTSLDPHGIGLSVELTVVNPNSRDLSVTEISSRILVDKTHEVGQVTLPRAIVLPAGKATKLDVPVSVAWSELGLLAQLAAGGGAVPYSVDGTVAMGGLLGVPFHLEGTMPHDQLVNAAVHSLPWLSQ